jgi:hypothetical protein
MRRHLTSEIVIAATLAAVACSDGTAPRGTARVSVALSTRQSPAVSASLQAAGSEAFTDGSNTLVITSVELVLRDVQLKRSDRDDCPGPVVVANWGIVGHEGHDTTDVDDEHGGRDTTDVEDGHEGRDTTDVDDEHGGRDTTDVDDEHGERDTTDVDDGDEGRDTTEAHGACDHLRGGPVVAALSLGSTQRMLTADVPAGTYDALTLHIHKPEVRGDAADRAFLATHPDLAGISTRVKGTYNGAAFTFTSDLNVAQKLKFDPPIQVTAGTPASLTVRLDLDGWFRSGGALVNPVTAGKGGVNEHLVRVNISRSFTAFRDNDGDGLDDDHEDQDGGH